MKKSNLQKLRHRDRVKCYSNHLVKEKSFTVYQEPEYPYVRLYQMNPNLLFTLDGVCVQVPVNSSFKIGDTLEFFKSDSQFTNKKGK
jgi:hypothetical protein